MSDDATPRLSLPYLAAAQAQKHVTLNEALGLLDGLVQTAVESRTVAAEPASPADGAVYILPQGHTGPEWSLHPVDALVRFESGGWTRLAAGAGCLAWIKDEAALVALGPVGWTPLGSLLGAVQNLQRLGLGAVADAANPLSVRLNKALFAAKPAAEGGDGDLRFTLNKETPADVLSLLFQSGFSGRAELGLTGDDDLRLKVSADGSAWADALVVSRADGAVTAPASIGVGTTPAKALHVRRDAPGAEVVLAALENRSTVANTAAVLDLSPTGAGPGVRSGQLAAITNGANQVSLSFRVSNGGPPAEVGRFDHAGRLAPGTDAAQDLGSAALRWGTVYAATGAINTSDADEKLVRGELSDAELRAWGRVRPRAFRFRAAAEAKGDDARLHAGLVAQEVRAAFEAEGLDAARYGLWCADPRPDGGERLGLRYDECLVMEAAHLRARLDALEGRTAALEKTGRVAPS
jgi:hypothetical protein